MLSEKKKAMAYWRKINENAIAQKNYQEQQHQERLKAGEIVKFVPDDVQQNNPNYTFIECVIIYFVQYYYTHLNNNLELTLRDFRAKVLSDFLTALPFHDVEHRQRNFRNINSILMECQNAEYVISGSGLKNYSKNYLEVWNKYKEDVVQMEKDIIKMLAKEGVAEYKTIKLLNLFK